MLALERALSRRFKHGSSLESDTTAQTVGPTTNFMREADKISWMDFLRITSQILDGVHLSCSGWPVNEFRIGQQ
jgi:hypothetical protein